MKVMARLVVAASLLGLITSPAWAQKTTLPLWPTGTPQPPQTTEPEKDATTPQDNQISGHRTERLTNVTVPTLTFYPPHSGTPDTHAAALVFPGGGYRILAWNGEGTDVCDWLNHIGLACLLVKYRVPEDGRYPDNPADLEDAQQAMRIAREHAAEWGYNKHKIGVIGFSAGGDLAVLLCTHWDDKHVESTPAASEVNPDIGARPDFAILGYPAYLQIPDKPWQVQPSLQPVPGTPPTFIIQAENDVHYGDSSIAYYRALRSAGIPAEMHLYATGGHGFGMHPPGQPEEHWPLLADLWLRRLGILPQQGNSFWSGRSLPLQKPPCPTTEPGIGPPNHTPTSTDSAPNPPC